MKIKSILPMLITVLALIAAHSLVVAWFGIKLSAKIGGWFLGIAGAALVAFGLHYVVQHIRGKGHGHFHVLGGHAHDRQEVERGPHDGVLVNLGHGFVEVAVCETDVAPRFRLFFYDQHKQARSLPRNATVKIVTLRPDGVRQTFTFRAEGEYLESTTDIPEPQEFKAIVEVSHGSQTHAHEVQFSEHDHAHHARDGRKTPEPATSQL